MEQKELTNNELGKMIVEYIDNKVETSNGELANVIMNHVDKKIKTLDKKIDAVDLKLSRKIDNVSADLDRFAAVTVREFGRLENKVDQLGTKVGGLEEKVDAGFEQLGVSAHTPA